MAEETNRLYKRILLLRWALPSAIFALVVFFETIQHILLLPFPRHAEFYIASVLLYGAAGPFLIYLALTWIAARVAEQQRGQQELEGVYGRLRESTSHLSTLHEISRTMASTVELREVMAQVANAIARGVSAEEACVGLFDEERGIWTHFSSNCEQERYGEQFPHIIDESLEKWRSGNKEPVISEVHSGNSVKGGPSLTLVTVPVARGHMLLGVISACLSSSPSHVESHLKMLTTVGDELAAAVEAARIRARHLQALYDVNRTIRTEFNLDQVLKQILDKAIQACSAEAGSVVLIEEETNELVVKATRNVPKERLAERLKADENGARWAVGEVVANHAPLIIDDTHTETRWHSHLAHNGIRSVISVPMLEGERVIGVINLGKSQPKGFGDAHLSLLLAIAGQAALVVRNTQLHNRAEELTVAEERHRIAREIHDGIAQNLAYLISKSDLCLILADKIAAEGQEAGRLKDELSAIKECLRDNIRGVRRSIFALRPLELERLGFGPASRRFIEDFGEQNGIYVQLNIAGEISSLPSALEPTLFRALQEALNNVAKHARARNVWIDLDLSAREQLALTVRDDGRGFDASFLTDAPLRGHVGLAQMEEKISSVGGALTIDTGPGQATTLEIKIPIKRQVIV